MHENFFALISRMRYIGRWGLMRNSVQENIQEHSHMVAVIAHALAIIRRDVFDTPCDPDRCAAMALYHDASEIITGDLPTPIKYHNAQLTRSYKEVENLASEKLVSMLPEALRPAFTELLLPDESTGEYQLVKAADKLSAYIKCIEERRTGNTDFLSAERQIAAALEENALPEVRYFLDHFMPAFEKTLDELGTI